MDNVEEFIDEFIAHDQIDAKRRAYNRQYYLRTRKLKGRQTGDVKPPARSTYKRNVDAGGRSKPVSKPQSSQQERRQIAAEKIRRAREAAKGLPPDKRNAVEKKLDAAEKKLKSFNPFRKKKKKKSKHEQNSKLTPEMREQSRKRRLERSKKRADAAKAKAKRDRRFNTIKKIVEIEQKIERAAKAPSRAKKKVQKAPGAAKRKATNQINREVNEAKRELNKIGKAGKNLPNAAKKKAKKTAWDTLDKIFD